MKVVSCFVFQVVQILFWAIFLSLQAQFSSHSAMLVRSVSQLIKTLYFACVITLCLVILS